MSCLQRREKHRLYYTEGLRTARPSVKFTFIEKSLRDSLLKGDSTVKLKETRFIVNCRSYEGRTEADCSRNFHRLFY